MSGIDDTGWTRATSAGARLGWARRVRGYTQDSFAEAVGFKRGAYRKYEADATPLKFEQANPWARKLKFRWQWLLEGKGTPFPTKEEVGRSPLAEEVADLVDSAEPAEQERIRAVVQAMRMTGTGG